MTSVEIELAERIYAELKPEIVKIYGSEAEFHRCFYLKKINPNADEITLRRYIGRVMKSKKSNPEKIAGWKCFFDLEQREQQGKSPTTSDGKAAWVFRLQVKSRITGKPGRSIGTPQAALNSTYKLFDEHRRLLAEHGPECAVFDELVEPYVNGPLRQFHTGWHHKKDIEGKSLVAFQEELLQLQHESSKLCSQLEKLY